MHGPHTTSQGSLNAHLCLQNPPDQTFAPQVCVLFRYVPVMSEDGGSLCGPLSLELSHILLPEKVRFLSAQLSGSGRRK